MYKVLSFRYQVFGTILNVLSRSGSDKKVFPNVRMHDSRCDYISKKIGS
jgi:hypothetical protein